MPFRVFNVLNADIETGTFIDTRDNQVYRWILMEDGRKWMSQNLNYNSPNSKCYGNNEDNCEKYGRLYNWESAMKSCPNGWRVPNDDEWWKMTSYYGKAESEERDNTGKKAGKKAYEYLLEGGKSGFSAQLGGSGYYYNREKQPDWIGFGRIDEAGYYWSSTKADIEGAFEWDVWIYGFIQKHIGFGSDFDHLYRWYSGRDFRSCRCIEE